MRFVEWFVITPAGLVFIVSCTEESKNNFKTRMVRMLSRWLDAVVHCCCGEGQFCGVGMEIKVMPHSSGS
jgi:hypothetical protein